MHLVLTPSLHSRPPPAVSLVPVLGAQLRIFLQRLTQSSLHSQPGMVAMFGSCYYCFQEHFYFDPICQKDLLTTSGSSDIVKQL